MLTGRGAGERVLSYRLPLHAAGVQIIQNADAGFGFDGFAQALRSCEGLVFGVRNIAISHNNLHRHQTTIGDLATLQFAIHLQIQNKV